MKKEKTIARAKNKHHGSSVNDWFKEEEEREPGFIAAVDALVDRQALAATVRDLRAQLGLSQAELAERVGTKQPGIARLESGRVVPRLELLQKIAVAAGRRLEVRFGPAKKPARRTA